MAWLVGTGPCSQPGGFWLHLSLSSREVKHSRVCFLDKEGSEMFGIFFLSSQFPVLCFYLQVSHPRL